MYKKVSLALGALATITLASCGGGGEGDLCGEKSQTFAVNFDAKAYTLKVGQAASVHSSVTPESCRSDISFSVENGSLPPGMSIANGDIVGTPTTAGTYKFQIYIVGIHGYQEVVKFIAPRSGQIALTVSP